MIFIKYCLYYVAIIIIYQNVKWFCSKILQSLEIKQNWKVYKDEKNLQKLGC